MSGRFQGMRGSRTRFTRRGGRGRGRGRREEEDRPDVVELPTEQSEAPQTKSAPPKSTFPRTKREETKMPDLKPKNLSKTSSEERNDPLINSLMLVPGINGFIEKVQNRRFQLDFTQYMSLIETSYKAQCAEDRGMMKFMSESMFRYYCVILLWKRIWSILSSRGIYTLEYQRTESLLSFDLPVPDDINLYLMGIGDISDSNSREFQIELQEQLSVIDEWFGSQGSFGRVDAVNHIMYETLPAPIISLLNIQADMQYTARMRNHNMPQEWEQLDWDLPADLRPENPQFTLPTVSLLGWKRRTELMQDSVNALHSAGFDLDNFGVTNIAGLPINQKLMQWIAGVLSKSKSPVTGQISQSRFGSLAQTAFTTRVQNDVQVTPFKRISEKQGITNNYSQNGAHVASGAAIFRYRMQRRVEREIDMLAYRTIQAVAGQWVGNENQIFDAGADLWNSSQFTTGEQPGELLIYNLSCRCKKITVRE